MRTTAGLEQRKKKKNKLLLGARRVDRASLEPGEGGGGRMSLVIGWPLQPITRSE